MRTHKSDENMPDCELYDHYQTIFVTPDIKDIMLVTNVVRKNCLAGIRRIGISITKQLTTCPNQTSVNQQCNSKNANYTFQNLI